MSARDFVLNCKAERDHIFELYSNSGSETSVSAELAAADLSESQRQHVLAAIDCVLTDAFYAVLLGLSGSASLGASQQSYQLIAENGDVVISPQGGDLETLAFEIFQGS